MIEMNNGQVRLHQGDSRDVLRGLADNSIDSVVSDPPYFLTSIVKRFGKEGSAAAKHGTDGAFKRLSGGFMNRQWDAPEVPAIDPGFAHWMAGFVDGEGCFHVHKKHVNGVDTYDCQFTISLRADDAPIIDEMRAALGGIGSVARRPANGNAKEQVRFCVSSKADCMALRAVFSVFPLRAKKARDFEIWCHALDAWVDHTPGSGWDDVAYYRNALMAVRNFGSVHRPERLFFYNFGLELLRVLKPGGHLVMFNGTRTSHHMVCGLEDAGFEIRDTLAWVFGSGFPKSHNQHGDWEGWGSALKPAFEPITLARKPLTGTIAGNLAEWGVGALNIDGCRVEADNDEDRSRPPRTANAIPGGGKGTSLTASEHNSLGRWPANIVHDGSDEVLAAFPDAKGQQGDVSFDAPSPKTSGIYGAMKRQGEPSQDSENEGGVGFKMKPGARRLDSGSAARFFYCAKASRKDRDEGLAHLPKQAGGMVSDTSGQHITRRDADYKPEPRANIHPTVKPTDLMRYLCRLITPPGGTILDPFMGSGSTGKAAVLEGFNFVGVEREDEYMPIAEARIAWAVLRMQGQIVDHEPVGEVAATAQPANDNTPQPEPDLFTGTGP